MLCLLFLIWYMVGLLNGSDVVWRKPVQNLLSCLKIAPNKGVDTCKLEVTYFHNQTQSFYNYCNDMLHNEVFHLSLYLIPNYHAFCPERKFYLDCQQQKCSLELIRSSYHFFTTIGAFHTALPPWFSTNQLERIASNERSILPLGIVFYSYLLRYDFNR